MLLSQLQRSKDQKYSKNREKETTFVYIIGFIFYHAFREKMDLHNEYDLTLCLAHKQEQVLFLFNLLLLFSEKYFILDPL